MNERKISAVKPPGPRQRAVRRLGRALPDKDAEAELRVAVHELQVHRVELEMQNEELRRTQEELQRSLQRYQDLYDFAPVGFITLDPHGRIVDANLTVATILGAERSALTHKRMGFLLAAESRAEFSACQHRALEEDTPQDCEVRLPDQRVFHVHLQRTLSAAGAAAPHWLRVALLDVTDRVRAQIDRAHAAIVATSDDAICSCDTAGVIVSWNKAAEHMFGYSAAEAIGRHISVLAPPFLAQEPAELMARVARGGSVRQLETMRRRKDGTDLHVSLTVSAIKDSTGRIVSFSEVVRDVSERTRARMALQEREARLGAIVDTARDGIIVVDANGVIEAFNPAAERLFQLTASAVVKCNIEVLMPPGDSSMRDTFFDNGSGEQRSGSKSEVKAQRSDGSVFAAELAVSEMWVGAEHKRVGIIHDISERKRREQALQRSEANLALAQAIAHVGSYEFDPSQPWSVHWSAETLRIFGLDPATRALSVDGMLQGMVPEQERPRVQLAFERLLKEKKSVSGEHLVRRPDGTVRHVRNAAEPVLDEHGGIIKVVGIIQDVTDLKRKEEELRASQQALRELSVRLQSIVEQERARIAREIHDELGSLLTRVRMDASWFAKDVQQTPANAERYKLLSHDIDAAIQTVRRIATALRPSLLDHLGLTAAIEFEAQEFGRRTGIACTLDMDELPASLPASLDQDAITALFRILQEALTNVGRHADATSVRIELHRDAGGIELKITDNGKGIEIRGGGGSKSLGILGMSERAKAFGGRLSVQPVPPAGTTVAVYIPLSKHETGSK